MADFDAIREKTATFEDFVLEVVKEDYATSKRFMEGYHTFCDEMYAHYTNSREYTSIRAENRFPMPIMQRDVDQFTADVVDKLFHAGRPARLIGRENTDRDAAAAKQAMLDYQDEVDRTRQKLRRGVRDAALLRLTAWKVDWHQEVEKRWVQVRDPIPLLDEAGNIVLNPLGQVVYRTDDFGQIMTYPPRWVRDYVITYEGPQTECIDPRNLFFPGDKHEVGDEYPIMVRSFRSKLYFKSRDYFIRRNVDKFDEVLGKPDATGTNTQDTATTSPDEPVFQATPGRPYEYVEWQGLLPKGELYHWLVTLGNRDDLKELKKHRLYQMTETTDEGEDVVTAIEIDEDELCWGIAGVVDDQLLVRLDENPFNTDRPNIVIGTLSTEEDGILAMGLSDRLRAVQNGMNDLVGMLLHNYKMSIDRGAVVNEGFIIGNDDVKTNQPGWIINTNEDIEKVVKYFDPPDMSNAIFLLINFFERYGQDSGGMNNPILGKGDPAADTLGEATMAANQAALRVRDYLRSFEDSAVLPLYSLKNAMNCAMIDDEYAYRVLGEQAEAWKHIDPSEIRADVDFICESSTRETNRAVLTQQILQLAKLAPAAHQLGQPTRLDKLMAKLCREGFGWTPEETRDLFVLLRMEHENADADIDGLLAQNALMAQRLQLLQGMMAGVGMSGGGLPPGGTAQPLTEEDANQQATKQSQPTVRETQ